jgi:hypothetical protein
VRQHFEKLILQLMIVFAGGNHGIDAGSPEPDFTHNGERVLKMMQEFYVNQIVKNRLLKDLHKKGLSLVSLPFFFTRLPLDYGCCFLYRFLLLTDGAFLPLSFCDNHWKKGLRTNFPFQQAVSAQPGGWFFQEAFRE